MLGYHKKAKEKAVTDWIEIKKTTAKGFFAKYGRRITSTCILIILCTVMYKVILPGMDFGHFMPFSKVTPKNLNRLSEDAFRKIIGYGYEEKIYVRDTAEIRARLEASGLIFGDIQFFVKFFPYELEIKFSEVRPLFALKAQRSDTIPVIYSGTGKKYPYSANAADLPVVDAKSQNDISLATNFLIDMRKNDVSLYSRISQVIPSEEQKQITVFFNDVDFKTIFSLDEDYWKTAFRYYRQLTRNMQVLNINSITVLDLRFKKLAYTTEKERRL